jgi:hypothetical protein
MINSVTQNYTEENLYNLLDAPPGSQPPTIDVCWERCEKTLAQRYAWKALRDPFYNPLYWETQSSQSLREAGFFDDGLLLAVSEYPAYDPRMFSTPVDKLSWDNNTPSVILVTTGSFSPVHKGHIQMMESARAHFESLQFNVVGGYIVPGHDSYVGQKNGGTAAMSAGDRIRCLELATQDIDWLMVDPWAARYMPREINFTDTLLRLRGYLRCHVPRLLDTKIVYVHGCDNYSFNQAFAFINSREVNFTHFSSYRVTRTPESSTAVRNGSVEYLDPTVKEYLEAPGATGVYQIRDDGSATGKMRQRIIQAIQDSLDDGMELEILDFKEQQRLAEIEIAGYSTISLDAMFTGTENLQISRVFHPATPQFKTNAFHHRAGSKTIQEQLSAIRDDSIYVLVEDDIASGSTIEFVKEQLRQHGIAIHKTLILNLLTGNQDNIIDVVDLRDFVLDSQDGGLRIQSQTGIGVGRAIYALPLVNMASRAKTPSRSELALSREIWSINRDYAGTRKLSECRQDTRLTFVSQGWSLGAYLIDICDFYYNAIDSAMEDQ